jgi:hypothetical protein
MFGHRYFTGAYFPDRYFPLAHGSDATEAPYFFHGVFAARYFPDRYFPGRFPTAPSTSTARYFYHGHFPARYFTDRYFPGGFPVGPTPPPSPLNVGVWQRPQRLPRRPNYLIEIDTELPVLVARVRAQLAPIAVSLTADALRLPTPDLSAALSARPVDVGMSLTLALRHASGLLDVRVVPPLPTPAQDTRRLQDEEEENALLERHS